VGFTVRTLLIKECWGPAETDTLNLKVWVFYHTDTLMEFTVIPNPATAPIRLPNYYLPACPVRHTAAITEQSHRPLWAAIRPAATIGRPHRAGGLAEPSGHRPHRVGRPLASPSYGWCSSSPSSSPRARTPSRHR
jgi:hypothetical protein